ncbi:CHAT domain-containing protein [Nostoc favosum]|uniref:CHAT domain-containing protein n=1 Tax=Nostoc favosum TaxID=2907819 RepID=UPI001E4446EA|nr:CHAT domain-containing protein [Nostoc favosum]
MLSACQTAKGNKMSALGIAGVAAQAGARSIIATLWLVDSKSSVFFINEFYKNLKHGIPKAEALRLAQISLMAIPEYNNPYHWAPYLLVGSWL